MGDFHGYAPSGLKDFVAKNNIDSIISPGDFTDAEKTRKIIFKYYNEKRPWYEIIGMKKARDITRKEKETTKIFLNMLNKLEIPVYIIPGNAESLRPTKLSKEHYYSLIRNYENIINVHKKVLSLGNYQILGFGGYGPKPEIKVDIFGKKFTKKMKDKIDKKENIINRLFHKTEPERTIFLGHDMPYNTNLDVVTYSGAPETVKGKHIGDGVLCEKIEQYQPLLFIGGHMHEHQGQTRIGKTVVVNPGYGRNGQCAIIELNDSRPKIEKIKFLRI